MGLFFPAARLLTIGFYPFVAKCIHLFVKTLVWVCRCYSRGSASWLIFKVHAFHLALVMMLPGVMHIPTLFMSDLTTIYVDTNIDIHTR